MPDLANRDPHFLRTSLSAWFEKELGAAANPEVLEVHAPGSNGFSNETILATVAWDTDGLRSEHRKVFRVHPTSHTLFLDANFSTQYLAMSAVRDSGAAIAIPTLGPFETDPTYLGVPFFTMDHVEGLVPADNLPYTMDLEGWVLQASDEERARMWWSGVETLATVARIDHRALDLGFLDRPAYGPAGLGQHLGYYRAYLDSTKPNGEVPEAERLWDWLIEHRPAEEGELVLSWGDARLGNIIWQDFRPAAVLDWEMASLAPAELDLGWWLYFNRQFTEGLGIPALGGFGSRGETIARYEDLLGRSMGDVAYYEVFAGFRFAVIMARLSDLLVDAGVLPADSDMRRNNLATQFTTQLLEG